jgi:hypothetical protein
MTQDTQEVLRVPEAYVLSATLTALQQLQFSVQIQQKADFEWVNRIAKSTGTFRVQIQDGATGRNLITNNPPAGSAIPANTVDAANYFGTAQLPNSHLQPYVFARSSSILVTLIDTSGAGGGNVIEINFDGFDLYPASAPHQGASGALVSQDQ